MPAQQARIALIGGGRMAEAMLRALVRARGGAQDISVGEPDPGRREHLHSQYGVRCCADNAEALDGAELVVLAVKPQRAAEVCAALLVPDGATVVSIMAGVPIAAITRWLGPEVAIVRAMPNTPALVGAGITGVHIPTTAAPRRAAVLDLLSTLGAVVEVDREELLDAVTAVSGSGPAYFYAFVEALAAAGAALGLDADTAQTLARQTFVGAARLAEAEKRPVSALREQVTSPGGTTAAALAALAEGGLDALVESAVRAAWRRAGELARQAEQSG